jgi:hypothetical protein
MKRQVKSESRGSSSSSYEEGEIKKNAVKRNQAVTREKRARRHRETSSNRAAKQTQNVT